MKPTSIATGATQQHNRKGALNRQGEARFICTDGAAATHSIWQEKIGNAKRGEEDASHPIFLFEDPMSRLQRAKHEEEQRRKQTIQRGMEDLEEELEEHTNKAKDVGDQKPAAQKQQEADLLACHRCKQFGHLPFQCMNMFSKEGKKVSLG